MKAVWTAVHRWDFAVDDPVWQKFQRVMHNGFQRQERIRWHYPHLESVVYVYPYAVFDATTNQPLPFATTGNLLECIPFEKLPFLSRTPFYPTNNRKGYWIDWTRIDLPFVIEQLHARAPVPKAVVGFMIDNIPEWTTLLGSEKRLTQQLETLTKLLWNLKGNIWVLGNVYEGGRGLLGCLNAGIGCFFEQSFWYWHSGGWLPTRSQETNRARILRVLQAGQKAVLHVPAMPESQHPQAVALLQQLANEAEVATLELSESRWQSTTRKSLVGSPLFEPLSK